mgnify:CR=1 FL=1
MTDATALRLAKEKFGPDAWINRSAKEIPNRYVICVGICRVGAGPAWEWALADAGIYKPNRSGL